MAGIDFSRYSVEELRQAQESIDAEQYPENYARLMAELAKPERQQQEQVELRAQEIKSHGAKKVFYRTLSVITGFGLFYMAYDFHSEGVIKGRHGSGILKLADSPIGFYLGITFYCLGGLYLLYMGLTGKGLEKNIKSDIK